MSSQLQLLFTVTVFTLLLLGPVIGLLVYKIFYNGDDTQITWKVVIAVVIYYVLFFTVLPKLSAPYVDRHTDTVQVCTYKEVWK